MPSITQRISGELTGPGGGFEVVREVTGGVDLPVYKDRLPNLLAVAGIGVLHGDKEFLVYGDRRITFTDFFRSANGVGRAWADGYGVGRGDRVAVLSANNPEWCLTFWATVNLGGILVGLNGWWKADEIVYGLQDSGSKILVADAGRFARIADRLDELPDLEAVFLVDVDPADTAAAGDPRLHRWDELTQEPVDDLPTTEIDEQDPAVIFYTSGTTGKPKGAISTHANMIANLQNTVFLTILGAMVQAEEVAQGLREAPPDGPDRPTVSLLTAPLFHVAGCHSNLVTGTMGGIKVVIPEGRFDPVKVLRLIEDEQVTIWATVPTMVWRLCEHPDRHDHDTSSVERVAFGGSPSADELLRKIYETFPAVRTTTNAYGLTETSATVTAISGLDALERPTSVGTPLPTVDVRIEAPDGTVLGPDETGEVCVRSPLVMPGYWNRPDATADMISPDGWLHTGDLGHVDEDGFVYITDRAKDMIIRGGENVYCVEIEERLVEHPEVADAAVIGVPHAALGEEVKAVVQVEPGATVTEADLKAWVAEALADFKVPAYVDLQNDNLPRNASGKLLKNVLRGEGEVSFVETM